MRAIAALTLFVSFSAAAIAGEWDTLRHDAVTAFRANHYDDAIAKFQASLALADTPSAKALTAYELGVSLHAAGSPRDAMKPLAEAFSIWKSQPNEGRNSARAAESLAVCERNIGDYGSAAKTLRQAMADLPAGEPQTIVRYALADLLREQGKTTEALRLFNETPSDEQLSWQRKYDVLSGKADIHRDAGDWQSALAEWTQASGLARSNGDATLEAIAQRGLGETWLAKGEVSRAEPLLRRSLNTLESDPTAALQLASTLASLAQVFIVEDKLAMARELLQRAIAIDRRTLNDRHPQVATMLRFLSDVESRRGNFEEAAVHVDEAIAIMSAAFGSDSPVTATVIASRGLVEQRASRFNVAAADYRAALNVLDQAGPQLAAIRAQVMTGYAAVLNETHRKGEANAMLTEARSFGTHGR